MSNTDFASLQLQKPLLDNLITLGYASMTPIQSQSLPAILDGKDVIAQAKTGSGKTAAFSLGILEKLNVRHFAVQSLILCPTRELADQVAKEIRKLARAIHNIKVLTLCGGMPFGPQVGSLEHGAHIIVGTPGRIEEHLRKGTLVLDNVSTLVLDEADRMLDMGFQEVLDLIISFTPDHRQTLLFSATYPEEIHHIAERVMQSPVMVKAESVHDADSIQQRLYEVGSEDERAGAVMALLLEYRPSTAVIFCNTKRETQSLADYLKNQGFDALALHGDLEQRDRDQTLVRFSNHSISVLVATDVAARGLDIAALDAVINYQIARETEVHVHRVGRTGRAGSHGMAFTLYTPSEDYKLERLAAYLEEPARPESLPHLSGEKPYRAPMVTLQIGGGKKQKIRPGDIVGALTGAGGVSGDDIGKIAIFDNTAFVAVKRKVSSHAIEKLGTGRLKGKQYRVRYI